MFGYIIYLNLGTTYEEFQAGYTFLMVDLVASQPFSHQHHTSLLMYSAIHQRLRSLLA